SSSSFCARPLCLIYPLSLHDALPISGVWEAPSNMYWMFKMQTVAYILANANPFSSIQVDYDKLASGVVYFFRVTYFGITTTHIRSEEHTSELQSRFDFVCRLLLEKN